MDADPARVITRVAAGAFLSTGPRSACKGLAAR